MYYFQQPCSYHKFTSNVHTVFEFDEPLFGSSNSYSITVSTSLGKYMRTNMMLLGYSVVQIMARRHWHWLTSETDANMAPSGENFRWTTGSAILHLHTSFHLPPPPPPSLPPPPPSPPSPPPSFLDAGESWKDTSKFHMVRCFPPIARCDPTWFQQRLSTGKSRVSVCVEHHWPRNWKKQDQNHLPNWPPSFFPFLLPILLIPPLSTARPSSNMADNLKAEEVRHGHVTCQSRSQTTCTACWYIEDFYMEKCWKCCSKVDSKYSVQPLGHLCCWVAWTWTRQQRSGYWHFNCKLAQPETWSRYFYLSNSSPPPPHPKKKELPRERLYKTVEIEMQLQSV